MVPFPIIMQILITMRHVKQLEVVFHEDLIRLDHLSKAQVENP